MLHMIFKFGSFNKFVCRYKSHDKSNTYVGDDDMKSNAHNFETRHLDETGDIGSSSTQAETNSVLNFVSYCGGNPAIGGVSPSENTNENQSLVVEIPRAKSTPTKRELKRN